MDIGKIELSRYNENGKDALECVWAIAMVIAKAGDAEMADEEIIANIVRLVYPFTGLR